MAVRIRLRRVGARRNPIWRIVVADQRSPRDGRTLETIGHYNAQTEPSTIVVDTERASYWLQRGARPSRTVARLLRTEGLEAHGSQLRMAEDGRERRLVELIVRSLVERPDAVGVEELEEDGDLVLEVTVDEEDMGRVIGRSGRVAQAIRTVARASAGRDGRRVVVDILD